MNETVLNKKFIKQLLERKNDLKTGAPGPGRAPPGGRPGRPAGGGWAPPPKLLLVKSIQREQPTKGAGSEASLPVTLRVRRRAPKLHIRPLAHCRAKWARPTTCPSNPTTCRFSLAEIRFLRYDILIRKEVTPHG